MIYAETGLSVKWYNLLERGYAFQLESLIHSVVHQLGELEEVIWPF